MAILALQGPELIRVGRVAAVYWPGSEIPAAVLAEQADAGGRWPGIPDPPRFPVRLVVTHDQRRFDSVTAGRVPGWGSGVAFPGTNTIVLMIGPDMTRVLRHEMAHLTLRTAVGRVPLWFDEGYASRAAGEWDRLEALRVNWALVRGRAPSLGALNRHLRAGAASAQASYGLATTAVLLLERLGGDRGLTPLLGSLAVTRDFDRALRQTYGMSLDQFEGHWHRELRTRYGWLLVVTSFSVFWSVVAGVVATLWARRRRRDRARREALDDGWTILGD